jgi:hypothetical protein
MADNEEPKKRRGHPEIPLTSEIRASILRSLRVGASLEDSALSAGISVRTLSRWKRRLAKATTGEWGTFRDEAAKAAAECKIRNLGIIAAASRGPTENENPAKKYRGTWTAAAWILERRYPAEYALHQRHELIGKDGGPMRVKGDVVTRIREYATAFDHLPTVAAPAEPASESVGDTSSDDLGESVDTVEPHDAPSAISGP